MKKTFALVFVLIAGICAQTLPGPIDIFQQPAFFGNAPRLICASPEDSVIAFVWNQEGYPNGDIWLADIPSGRLRQLTHYNDIPTTGRIENLQWFPNEQRLIFLWQDDIYSIRPSSEENPSALTITPTPEIMPRISPNGRYVSFIRDNTLRLLDVRESREIQLSETVMADWKQINRFCENNRYEAYYWAPDETALIMPAFTGPFAGELFYFDLINQETRIITLSEKDNLLFRDIAWLPEKMQLAVDCLSSDLKQRSISLIDFNSQQIDTVYAQDNSLWQSNFGGKLFWLPEKKKLLFGDIQNGYQHIFTVGLDHKTPISITRGKWNVFDYTVAANSDQVYFSANKDNPYEKHIYTFERKSEKVQNLSYLSGCHDFILTSSGKYVIDIYSTTDKPPQLYLTRTFPVSKARLLLKSDVRIPNAANLKTALDENTVDPVTGKPIHYKLWYPAGQLAADKFPMILLLNNPAGPVDNLHEWKISNLICQWLSDKGYVVAEIDFPDIDQLPDCIDASEPQPPWKQQLRTIEIVIEELAEKEFIDMTRIGVSGFGYNAYLAISALLERADLFSVCVGINLDNYWETDCSLYERIIFREMAARNLDAGLKNGDMASKIRGKLLLIYSANGTLNPLLDSEMLIRQMVDHRKRIDFIHYPWEQTVIQSDETYIDLLYKLLEYFDRFL